MSLKSRFFDSISGDRVYTSQDLAEILARLVTRDGVVFGYANQMRVLPTSPESLAVRVDLGAAWVQGRYVEVYSGPEQLSVATPDGTYDRIDRVVVRLDLQSTGRTITLAVKQGTPAATPSPPALQRDTNIWELSLAKVRVRAAATSVLASDITDERGNPSVCGYTAPATLQGTGSGLVAQDSAYSSGVPGFTPATVKAALDALAGVRIVEKGSNANGEYVRWENGLQCCWSRLTGLGPAQTAWGSIYVSTTYTWTFPAAFVAGSAYALGVARGAGGYATMIAGIDGAQDTQFRFLLARGDLQSAATYSADLFAVGRWK